MPFTALNTRATAPPANKSAPPEWLRTDLSELPPDIIESVEALWKGESRAFSSGTVQKVITAFHTHIKHLKNQLRTQAEEIAQLSRSRAESPSKKRALDDAEQTNGHQEKKARLPESKALPSRTAISPAWTGTTFEGVSFTIPQRKKLSLVVSSSKQEGLLVKAPGSNDPDFGIPWSSIEHIVYLPVPEKTQAQKTFIVLPRGVDGLSENNASPYETMVWTVSDTKPKGAAEDEPTQAQASKAEISKNYKVLEPNPKDFTSEIPPVGGKKGDKAFHIKGFRGSKDGYLFLLPTGIIWTFKKPLLFFSFASIQSISYTSVLQRTFNLVISARPSSSPDAEPTDYEFSMLDQADFTGIDGYIKKYGLQDGSLADERRAKVYGVNGKKTDEAEAGEAGDGVGEESELAKAEREINAQEEEDDDEEDDENFDPGSESDGGSPAESESEDETAGNDGGGGLVDEELGSEAEDVDLE